MNKRNKPNLDSVFVGFNLYILCVIIWLMQTGCATTYLDRKRSQILECVKDLRHNEFTAEDAERICRGVYEPQSLNSSSAN